MPVGSVCVWKRHEAESPSSWDTACGDSFYGDGATLEEYGFRWCPFCGTAIREKEKPDVR